MAQNRDPAFWRRFSTAIHLDEESKATTPEKEVTLWSDNWIKGQERKRRRTILCGFLIFFLTALFVVGVIVVIVWLNAHHWLREVPKST
ncbi:uncharacterized protein BO97DRAFT_369870 [Aspergillus homomorphus CBS 101889]|uniref:Uncharacterized protein n=1 Tax=Aspergillus homomorphus (strain CBS 101889) TaxID=1450537 RepID=A0A395HVG3_ASPHC|nr:hypothetical protein BO97DRAFT_369870 [Aspergillus homomorphus CBS 101889]RAL11922.1 hypothetical protein BO97DRAFT_369870 [Aspergillus homomorphus CBS 101889]